jgi:hypothetical protein
LGALQGFAGLKAQGGGAAEAHWSAEKRHHQARPQEVLAAPAPVLEAYEWLLAAAQGPEGSEPSPEPMDRLFAMLEGAGELYGPAIKRSMPGLIRRGRLAPWRRSLRQLRVIGDSKV